MSVIIKLNDKKAHFKNVPKELKSEVTKKLSCQWKAGSKDLTRGLSYEQELVIMPNLIGVKPNDPNWTFRVRDFWADFSLAPDAVGRELIIETKEASYKDENGEIKKIQIPINPEDYMAWQVCLQSSLVAKTADDMENLEYFDFIMIDKGELEKKEEKEFELLAKSDIAFSKLINKFSENEDTIDWVLELLRDKGDPTVFELEGIKKQSFLRTKKEASPSKFLSIVDDPELANKALIAQLVTYGILSKEGNDYYYLDDKIGTTTALIAYLKDSTKSATVGKMKSQLESKLKEAKQQK